MIVAQCFSGCRTFDSTWSAYFTFGNWFPCWSFQLIWSSFNEDDHSDYYHKIYIIFQEFCLQSERHEWHAFHVMNDMNDSLLHLKVNLFQPSSEEARKYTGRAGFLCNLSMKRGLFHHHLFRGKSKAPFSAFQDTSMQRPTTVQVQRTNIFRVFSHKWSTYIRIPEV